MRRDGTDLALGELVRDGLELLLDVGQRGRHRALFRSVDTYFDQSI